MLSFYDVKTDGRRLAHRFDKFSKTPDTPADHNVEGAHIITIVDFETLIALVMLNVDMPKINEVLPEDVLLKIKKDQGPRFANCFSAADKKEVVISKVLEGDNVWPGDPFDFSFRVFSIVDISNCAETFNGRLGEHMEAYHFAYKYDVFERIAALRATAEVDVFEISRKLPRLAELLGDAEFKINNYLRELSNFGELKLRCMPEAFAHCGYVDEVVKLLCDVGFTDDRM